MIKEFRFITASLVLLTGCAGQIRRPDPWFGPDKAVHFLAGAAIGGGTTASTEDHGWSEGEARGLAFGVTLTLGTAKELYDLKVRETGWSWKDLAWTVVGTLTGNLIATSLD